MKLVLHRLNDEQDEFETVAEWSPNLGETVPDEFLRIYNDRELWHEKEPEYFLNRINGPTVMLTRVD